MDYIYDRRPKVAAKLDSSTRQRANRILQHAGFDGKGRFRSMGQAMNAIAIALGKSGIELAEVATGDHFRADQAHIQLDVAFSNPENSYSPDKIRNSVLAVSYTKLERDRYEVIAYLS